MTASRITHQVEVVRCWFACLPWRSFCCRWRPSPRKSAYRSLTRRRIEALSVWRLYDQNHVLVRSLLCAEPVEVGTRATVWDGTTDLGVRAPAGNYTAEGVFFKEPPQLKFVMKVGKSGNPPWWTPDGKGNWGGNLGGPSAIVANQKSLIMCWSGVEDNQTTGVQQMDANGNIESRYFTFYGWDARMAAAIDERNFYLGINDIAGTHGTEIAEYQLGQNRGRILAHLPVPTVPTASGRWKGRPMTWMDGMALTPDTIYATVGHADTLYVVDRKSGQLRSQVKIPEARGLAVSPDGQSLLAVAGQRVLQLGLDGQPQRELVAAGTLNAPSAIAIDKQGNFFVGDSGAHYWIDPERDEGTQQVYVYSPQGKLIRRLGMPDGTPNDGKFDQRGFGIIHSLCLGPDGKLWVQDTATGFKRTSRWSIDAKPGDRPERQWFARKIQHYADKINPARPDEVVTVQSGFDDDPGIWGYSIDWEQKTWQPAWHYRQKMADMRQDELLGYDHGGNPLNAAFGREWMMFQYFLDSEVTQITSHQGRNYLINNEGIIYTYGPDAAPQADCRRAGPSHCAGNEWQMAGRLRSRTVGLDHLVRRQQRRPR